MRTTRGFTLIEVLIASGVLACGLVAVAALFSFVIRTNGANRQMAVATALLYDKMEEFRSISFTDAVWVNANGSETVVVGSQRFIRAWQVGRNTPRAVTVIVYAEKDALVRRQTELIRATTLMSPIF